MAFPLALRQGYASTYTISGCSDPADCGVFSLVPARCTGSHDRCPGGGYANENTDPTLCDNAPTYQSADGTRVLLRVYSWSFIVGRTTQWWVTDSTALDDCAGTAYYLSSEAYGHDGRPGSAPTLLGYSAGAGWRDWNNRQEGSIHVTGGGEHCLSPSLSASPSDQAASTPPVSY